MADANSPESELFVSTARAFLDKYASLRQVRALHAAGLSFDPAWWVRAAELGWVSLLVPEELGGGSISGDGLKDLALIAENLGHTVAPGPLHPVSVVVAGLAEADNRDQHAGTIESLMSGAAVAAWAVDEPHRPFAPQQPTVTATSTAAGYRIDGVKDRVEAGAEAELLLVVARGQDGPRQFLVPADAPGVTVTAQRSLDLVKRYARVCFDGVDVDASATVGSPAQTPALIDRQAQIAVALQCAELVGILDTVLAMTIRWALDRHSFGRPLASYQALKHRLADMKMWLEASRGITYAAVTDVAARRPDAQLTVSAAKSYIGEHATTLAHECVQLHGGIGVTWEHDLHLFLRRITLYRSMFGTPAEHHWVIYTWLRSARSVA
ncbi:acyl-CoA dehydrogenase family protein [Mycobacterium sp. 852002-51057_SCH5723018]|uniref:acyl-CoA dehydrogenase family protein n=1 Tax=Mycobacterium sp. 852002-51057_SCH5723018 TaxID=1834094 RepID=UPI000801884E|nr:acyl-CoA dehydrogenase family protein [Mycobacterium sp. 852002-51057_SCH5723018]OBG28801.1 acyl-CoA dehydrogenase [Mycobacterium sp. 852002-51057_SCH5723018]